MGTGSSRRLVNPVTKAGYELVFEDTFDGDSLDVSRWMPDQQPQDATTDPDRPECGAAAMTSVQCATS